MAEKSTTPVPGLPISSHPQPGVQIHQSSPANAFIAAISQTVRSSLSRCRPLSELLDRSALSKPESISDATVRFRKNYSYFRGNYLAIVAAVVGISLLTNPFSLFLLAGLLGAWIFLYLLRQPSDPPITLFGRQFSNRETLAFLIVSTIVVVFMTSVGRTLASAAVVGVVIVCVHGAFRSPDSLFLDETESQGDVPSLLSLFLGGSQPSSGATR